MREWNSEEKEGWPYNWWRRKTHWEGEDAKKGRTSLHFTLHKTHTCVRATKNWCPALVTIYVVFRSLPTISVTSSCLIPNYLDSSTSLAIPSWSLLLDSLLVYALNCYVFWGSFLGFLFLFFHATHLSFSFTHSHGLMTISIPLVYKMNKYLHLKSSHPQILLTQLLAYYLDHKFNTFQVELIICDVCQASFSPSSLCYIPFHHWYNHLDQKSGNIPKLFYFSPLSKWSCALNIFKVIFLYFYQHCPNFEFHHLSFVLLK